jgi:hypothetical protein
MQPSAILGIGTLGGLFLGMVLFLEAGHRLRLRMMAKHPEKSTAGLGVVEGALFGLMGLVIAFTFSGAAARLDAKRHLIVDEANNIGTAYLRIDLLPASAQPELREKFRQYVDARLESYTNLSTVGGVMPRMETASELQQDIWKLSIAATREATYPQAGMLLLPALNAMFDIANTRAMVTQLHPPPIIFVLLATLALVCSLLAGFGMAEGRTRSWIHVAAFAIVLTITVYVIIDMEYPRVGFIRIDKFDQALMEVRASMK